jgi:diguanylate cyclase (GGDEF)-like protein
MAFRVKNRGRSERGEVELLRGLIRLANQLQSSLELDAIVHVIAMALSDTFGFREASVYLADTCTGQFRVRATVGEHPDYDRELFDRPVPPKIWDELFLEKYQIGSSYFVDHRQHQWTEEQLHYLPELDLGPRGPGEWHPGDDLLVPLFDKKRELMGVLDLYDPADRALPTLELVKSLEVFSTHAAVAIENARQYEQLEHTTAALEAQLGLRHAMIEASAALLSTLDERTLLSQIAALLKEIVDYDAMEIRLVDEDAQELYCGFATDADYEQVNSWRTPLDVGVTGWVLQHNEAQLVNDMLNDPRGARVPGTEWEPQASIIAPLTVGGRAIGVLALDRMGERTFADGELESTKLFANLAAIAMHNARQYEKLEHTSAQLESQLALRHRLLDLSTVLLGTLDLRAVFREITSNLKDMVDYDALDIRRLEVDKRELVSIYLRDDQQEAVHAFRYSVDEGVGGWVARHNEAQLVNDMVHDPRVVTVPGTDEDEPQASIIVPLVVRGEVTGVLSIDRHEGRLFDESELEPVKLFANLAAIAIDNASSYEEMQRQAISDGLTGIFNYRHFHETLKREVGRAGRYGETFCLLMMDLDHFKAVNDSIGHQAGDEVLRAVAGVLRDCSRESDFLARYGGEEFTMILPRTYLDEAQTLAERIRAAVEELVIDGADLRVTMSIGVAAYPESALDSDGVLGASDAALLRAKTRGRNRVCLHTDGQTSFAAELEGDLVALGRRFARFIGLDEAETAGLLTALAVHETGGAVQDEVQSILGSGKNGDVKPNDVRRSAVDALVYGNERWDGSGYPEGRRGSSIPRVARAFAVCRRYDVSAHNGFAVEDLRGVAAKELDPTMVQRFSAMLRADQAEHN